MLRRLVLTALCATLLVASTTAAQQPPPPPPPPKAEAQPAPPPPPPPPPRAPGQPVTIRVELTVSDQVGTATPTKRTMTMLAADRGMASVRAGNRAPGWTPASFNVDARPVIDSQDKIRLELSIFYDPPPVPRGTDKDPEWTTSIQESLSVIVDNGKPLVVSQSADPRTDRKVTVEVRATILK